MIHDWRIVAVISVGLWGGLIGAFLYPRPAPIASMGGDSVSPAKVRTGSAVIVSRNLAITQAIPMHVNRTMVKGDCRKNCEIIDLTHGRLLLDEGEYRNLEREHIIPPQASPGVWRLKFSVGWSDAFGRQKSIELPELSFEVVK